MLHYILKCIHLEWRWLFGPFRYRLIQTVRFIDLIISIPDEELFSETTVGCTASYFVKVIWCSRWFCTPPILRLCIALFAVAEGWLLLDIGWFVLFLSHSLGGFTNLLLYSLIKRIPCYTLLGGFIISRTLIKWLHQSYVGILLLALFEFCIWFGGSTIL